MSYYKCSSSVYMSYNELNILESDPPKQAAILSTRVNFLYPPRLYRDKTRCTDARLHEKGDLLSIPSSFIFSSASQRWAFGV